MLFKHLVQPVLAATSVLASPLVARDVIKSLDTAVPDGPVGQLYVKHQPSLATPFCDPSPVVDGEGHVYFNKDDSQRWNKEKCPDSDRGQIYVRSLSPSDPHNPKPGFMALMYTWYFPFGTPDKKYAIKNDWQQVVYWLKNNANTQTPDDYSVVSTFFSTPGGYQERTGDATQFRYNTVEPSKEGLNKMGLDVLILSNIKRPLLEWEKAKQQPLIAWEKFTPKARAAVSNNKFFDGKVAPFSDAQFFEHLKASLEAKKSNW